MRVLMTADAVGGVWTYALELSSALASRGAEVVLATMGPLPGRDQRATVMRLKNVELVSSEYRLEWMQDPWDDVNRAGDWLLALAQRQAVDLVHLNGYVHASLPWQCPTLVVAHSCVCSWWRSVHGVDAPPRWSEYRERVTRGLNETRYVVAPTRAFLEQLRTCHVFTTPTCVIGNAGSDAFSRGDAPGKLPIVFSCGRAWDRAKNMTVLAAVATQLPWPAYVAGSTAGPDGAAEFPSSLCCLGTLGTQDVARWLECAAIFAHPALYEPFGLSVLEAAAHGCALALADLPSLRELWDGAAEFFDPRDPGELATVLQSLISDPDARRRRAAAARARARTFRIDSMADRYVDLYRRLIAAARFGQQEVA